MRYLFIATIIILVSISAIALLSPYYLPAAENVQPDISPMLSACAAACSDLINMIRANPDTSIFRASGYCRLYYDTSAASGVFVDHCYEEYGDVLRSGCNIAMLNGTVVQVGC
jgi:hypothetical protein